MQAGSTTAGSRAAQARARRYRNRLAQGASPLSARIAALPDGASVADIHARLAATTGRDGTDAFASLAARVELALGTATQTAFAGMRPQAGLQSTPPIRRASMAPRPWRWRSLLTPWRRVREPAAAAGGWHRIASRRRALLLAPVLVQAAVATYAMLRVLPDRGARPIEIVLLALFAILNAWIGIGFWTAVAGFVLLLRGGDRHAITATATGAQPLDAAARTAIVMPVCNEDVARVFAGLRATYESVQRSGELERFDFFVLSDTADADLRVAERAAWLELCRACNAFGRVFYRLRRLRIKRKSGNIADFCRRWGRNYRYMVVFDADSVMTGACLVQLVRLMEANPGTGIIQTAPLATGRDTLHARIQQFASRVYGPMFVAGMHFWQLGESHYWGHNAIIRVEPFMRHCALARLPGRGTLSGEILSHDFVEAALMRRAGWAVWTAYDLRGSFEEMPPNLLDELKRDRRWCQGNLINSRLLFAHGLHPAHRAVFATGVMAYVSALLWFAFLALSTVALALYARIGPSYIVEWHQLFALWPQWHPAEAIALSTATAAILFLPKILAVLLLALRGAGAFGGRLRLAAGALLEVVYSSMLAPIRMLVHTQFVIAALIGWNVAWQSPARADHETGWGEALRRHGVHTLIGLGWGAYVYRLNPGLVWWLAPVAGALALSIPVSVLSSRVRAGRAARHAGLFVIPEERQPPRVWRRLREHLRDDAPLPHFSDAVVDPLINAIACASDAARLRHSPAVRRRHDALAARALAFGPDALAADERRALLGDAHALTWLHDAIWNGEEIAAYWREARDRDLPAVATQAPQTHAVAMPPPLAAIDPAPPAAVMQRAGNDAALAVHRAAS